MGDPITLIARWLESHLLGLGLSPVLVTLILAVLGVILIASFVLVMDIFLVWVERKGSCPLSGSPGTQSFGTFRINPADC